MSAEAQPLFSTALREAARERLAELAGRASGEGGAPILAVAARASQAVAARVRDADGLLHAFDACGSDAIAESGFFLAQPTRSTEWLARGEAHLVARAEASATAASEPRDPRLSSLGGRVRDALASIELVAAPAALEPRLVGGLAYRDREGTDPLWAGFGSECLWLPRELWRWHDGELDCVVCVPVEGGESASASLDDALARAEALAAGRSEVPTSGSFEAPTRRPSGTDSQLLRAEDAVAPEYCAASDRPHAEYCDGVARAVDAIAGGHFEKVVLARSLRVRYANGPGFECGRLLQTLRAANPECTTFAIRPPGDGAASDGVFLGASPELLARVEGDRVETLALAGSAARGRNPDEDARYAAELVESKKQQREHRTVVEAIQRALAGLGLEAQYPEAPSRLALSGIQHLATPIEATRANSSAPGVAELVACLHPTPAVCGLPRREAEEWIDAHEGLERGWYAGPVGMVGANGEGEFHVALRSAIVSGPEARLFAGAGIVEGSEPEVELAETRIKLRTLLAPLTEI